MQSNHLEDSERMNLDDQFKQQNKVLAQTRYDRIRDQA